MRLSASLLLTVSFLTLLSNCAPEPAGTGEHQTDTATTEETAGKDNILTAAWTGPYDGVPAFDRMDLSALKPALEAGMARNLAEIDAITANPDAPTFANTILAMEDAGRDLGRVFAYYGIWRSNLSSPEFREIQQEMAPVLSAFSSKISQNAELFARIETIRRGDEFAALSPAQQRLVDRLYLGFVRSGATLSGDAKARYAEINQELAVLHTNFSNNILADEEKYVLYLSEDQLGGLSESYKAAASKAAEDRDQPEKYAVTNTRSSAGPFMTFSDQRDLREKVWRTFYSRGDNGDENDNNANIAKILQLRHERVQLLGYETYADWKLEDRMAKSPDRAYALMETVWSAATERVREEVADMQAIADREGAGITIAPWDYRYYAEKVRQEKYDLDSDEVREYLQLDNLREALFHVAGELFNYSFTPTPEGAVPVFHPDVKVWEVTDRTSGKHIGLWYLDPYARPGKRSGAWATTYRSHESFKGEQTVLASNNSNFIPGAAGEPVLISWDDASTLFHEFGHALHYLSSQVEYPSLNGGLRDYTEFQSQLLEHWLSTDDVIEKFLVHYKTGNPMPAELIEKIRRAATFNQGFATTEYLASALVDMKLHSMDPAGLDPAGFEREILADLGMPKEIVMRHRMPHFGHIFSGEGYSAGYYGYLWAEVLTADAAEAFAAAPGGFYDRNVAERAVKYLFSVGNEMDPADAYRAFRGRDASSDALMRDRGFPVAE